MGGFSGLWGGDAYILVKVRKVAEAVPALVIPQSGEML